MTVIIHVVFGPVPRAESDFSEQTLVLAKISLSHGVNLYNISTL